MDATITGTAFAAHPKAPYEAGDAGDIRDERCRARAPEMTAPPSWRDTSLIDSHVDHHFSDG